MKANGIARFEYVARINFSEPFVIDAQDFRVAAVGGPGGDSQLTFEIENPAGNPICILSNQRALAAGNLHLVEIVPGFVAIV